MYLLIYASLIDYNFMIMFNLTFKVKILTLPKVDQTITINEMSKKKTKNIYQIFIYFSFVIDTGRCCLTSLIINIFCLIRFVFHLLLSVARCMSYNLIEKSSKLLFTYLSVWRLIYRCVDMHAV